MVESITQIYGLCTLINLWYEQIWIDDSVQIRSHYSILLHQTSGKKDFSIYWSFNLSCYVRHFSIYHILPPFWSKFVGTASPNLSGCFLFLLEVLVATEGCSPSATEVSSVELGDATSMSSLLLSDCESVDSVLIPSGSSRAIWLPLTSTLLFEFPGWMHEVFIPLRIKKVAGTVGELFVCLKRTRSHR